MANSGLLRGRNAVSFFEAVGRQTMDFGLGAFIEKFEEHYGQRMTRGILALIGVTVVSVCLSTIFTLVLRPIWAAMSSIFPINSAMDVWFNVTGLVLIVWWSLMAGSKTLDAYRERKIRLELSSMLSEVNITKCEYERLKSDFAEYKDKISASYLIAHSVLDEAEKKGFMDQELIDQLRSLIGTEQETPL